MQGEEMTTKDASCLKGLLSFGYILSPNIFPEMTGKEKEEFIEELCHTSEKARQMLLSLTRKDIMDIISIETGREIRSTNKQKPELVELLFRVVYEKIHGKEKPAVDRTNPAAQPSTLALPLLNAPTSVRSKRKSCHPSRLLLIKYCPNSACRAPMRPTDDFDFCKRCSCCICHKYDENKTPSFWLVCESDSHSQDKTCGLSCHLECALANERSCNLGNGRGRKLDGSYECGNCGHLIDLISCWKKLLTEAKDVRRVSDLCSRIHLSHKILNASEKYQDVHKIVDSIKRKLEDEVGSLSNLPLGMSRRLVHRLSVGAEVQKLCSRAIGLFGLDPPNTFQSNHVESQKCEDGVTNQTNSRGEVHVLVPEPKGNVPAGNNLLIDLNELPENHAEDYHSTDGELKTTGIEECGEGSKGKNGIRIGCRPVGLGALHRVKDAGDHTELKYRETVNVIRRLEIEGHIDGRFRKEFLTWLSMQATPKNAMQVSVFIDTFSDDPRSLAEQLVHTFGEEICRNIHQM